MMSTASPETESSEALSEKISRLSSEWSPGTSVSHFFVEKLWPQIQPEYEEMLVAVSEYLRKQISMDRNISGVTAFIEGRVKGSDSIYKSIQRRKETRIIANPEHVLHEVHDLIGLRIIVDTRGNILKMDDFIEQHFRKVQSKDVVIFSPYRQNLQDPQKPTEFGAYETHNHYIHLPESCELTRFHKVMLEIQVTTIGEALFNIFDHELTYKGYAGPLQGQDPAWLDTLHGAAKQLGIAMSHLTGGQTGGSKASRAHTLLKQFTGTVKEARSSHPRQLTLEDTDQSLRRLLCSLADELNSLIPNSQGATDKQREKLVQSFKFPQMNDRRNKVVDSYSDTFYWIFKRDDQINAAVETAHAQMCYHWYSVDNCPSRGRHPRHCDSFSDWMQSESKLYWLSGKPGSGKSTLVNFILQDSRTQEFLDRWKPGAITISHFFWKASSSSMQKNMKGMFCSLLHQLAFQNEYVQHLVMSRIPNWSNKDDYSDWCEKDLSSLLDEILTSIPAPVFLMIDGLDEILTDETLDLLSAVARFRELRNVKVCVSSRPEPLFQREFDTEKQLRLQDLTRGDMQNFASSIITKDWYTARGYDQKGVDELKDLLASNAEGVFLWLRLAGENLKRGYRKGDTLKDLRNRLETLPRELNDLYTEMWRRLNEDTQSNRESGASYINILLHIGSDSDFFLMNSLAFLMTSTNHEIQRKYVGHLDEAVNWVQFVSLCEETRRLVENRCAGLFQVTTTTANPHERLSVDLPQQHPAIGDILLLDVSIVHRSAYDFLNESVEGLKIRSLDHSSADDRNYKLLQGYLVLATILGKHLTRRFWFDQAVWYLGCYDEISEKLLQTFVELVQPLLTAGLLEEDDVDFCDLSTPLQRHIITYLAKQPKQRASRILRECLIPGQNTHIFNSNQDCGILDITNDQEVDVWARGAVGGNPRHFLPFTQIDIWPAHNYLDTITYLSAGALILFQELNHSEYESRLRLVEFNARLHEYPHVYDRLFWSDCNEFIPFTIGYWNWNKDREEGDWSFSIYPFVKMGVVNVGDDCIFVTLKCNLAFLAKMLSDSESSKEFAASLMLVTYNWTYAQGRNRISSILPASEQVSTEIMDEKWSCFQSMNDGGIALEKTLKMVREYFCSENSENSDFKPLEEPVGHFLAREDCGYKFVKDIDPEELEPDLMINGF
ncbi:uncharacterized protein PgNI_12016 [Pyricularia grisea]|uniref:NACHT domain-containing protein n=1 Tax=Pyricularia grisea TaxID=148305 RepID=A0A6P8AQT9_PYRGI|nr:uncharacterized protein PgNI_12016 [Pyricularia grisea]TLD04406.1 hypothetical protein PgNI_12016 [Pyricularia grisea]